MTVQLSSSQMQPTILLLLMDGTRLGSSLVPEAAFGGSILYGSSPFCAAIMISLSSPVACSSSVGTPPPEAMDRVAAAPRGPWALRACAAKAPTPRSNLEAISPETSRCTSGNRLSKTGGTSVGERLTTPGQPSASCSRPAEAALKVDAAHAQLCLSLSLPPRRLPPPRGRGIRHRDR